MKGCYRRYLVVMLLALVVGLAACSADDTRAIVTVGGEATSTVRPEATTTSTTSTTAPPPTTLSTVPSTTVAPITTTVSIPNGIPWQDALDYVGQKVTILGPVVDTAYAASSNGSPTFLNVGLAYPDPDRFQVVIWGEDRGRFDSPPEDLYWGHSIAVTGIVKNYKGVAEIIVTRPSQMKIY